MISALITFLGSPIGGALIGYLQKRQEEKREDEKAEKQQRHEQFMAQTAHVEKMYAKDIDAARIKPIKYVYEKKQTRLKWFLWGKPLECVTRIEKDKLSQTPRERASSIAVLALVATYCLSTIWVALWIWFDFKAIPMDTKQAGFSFFGIFKVAFGGNKAIDQSGIAYLMYILSPINFIISNWIIRKPSNK